jgi:hypothetical protein
MTDEALEGIADLRRKAGDLPVLARLEARIQAGPEA